MVLFKLVLFNDFDSMLLSSLATLRSACNNNIFSYFLVVTSSSSPNGSLKIAMMQALNNSAKTKLKFLRKYFSILDKIEEKGDRVNF